ncbi:globin [Deinococcus hohokamensis]|uniref:Globin n=1 Tax=Deinococcus hohokamensis TaxID=309883 RepID=A0ABV9I3N0_9DEIO
MTKTVPEPAELAGFSVQGLDALLPATLRLQTLSPLPGVPVAAPETLARCGGLLVPHDGEPVADVRDRPDRWAALALVTQALRRDLPVLAWGSGAALMARALGAPVQAVHVQAAGPQHPVQSPERAGAPRGATLLLGSPEAPAHWQLGRVRAWAGTELPAELLAAFLGALPQERSRRPGSPLEALGGEATLRRVLTDFYDRARRDELLGPVFGAHVTDWAAHLDQVTAFWVTMLGGGARWTGHLGGVHAGLGVQAQHLSRWLELFAQAVQAHLPPAAAADLIRRAETMGARLGPRRQR